MTYLNPRDFKLEVARGNVTGISQVSKFGAAPDGVQTSLTDIWDRADSTPTQQIWLAPTAARTHQIVSTSTDDDGNPVGTGARTIRVYGLQTWGSSETSEDITMDGTSNVATSNSYVIIHRMKVLTSGSADINVGTITATADTDGTVTALILPSQGQTEMAIYGVPSTETFYLTRWDAAINKASGVAITVDFEIRVNPNPDVQTTNFLRKENLSLQSTGTSMFQKHYENYPSFSGPCIIKIQGVASSSDADGRSGFDGFRVTN